MEQLAASGGQDFDLTISASILFQGNQGGLSVRANLRIRWVQASSGRLACGDRGGIHDVVDPKFADRHSAPSNIDGTTGLITDE